MTTKSTTKWGNTTVTIEVDDKADGAPGELDLEMLYYQVASAVKGIGYDQQTVEEFFPH